MTSDDRDTTVGSETAPPDVAVPSHAEADAVTPSELPVVVREPEQTRQPLVPAEERLAGPGESERDRVHVPANLHELIFVPPFTPEEVSDLRRRRRLNEVVHALLSVGVWVSTVVMLGGLALGLAVQGRLPDRVPQLDALGNGLISLSPSAFLGLGMLLLIATPILRVLGSLCVFLYERDWRYAGVTLTVIVVLFVSFFAGKG
jgi:uncharacterized membrane protein